MPSEKDWEAKEQAGSKERGCGGNEFLPACSARRRRAGGGKAFPQFCGQQNVKTENFSFPYKDKRAKEWCEFATKLTRQNWDYLKIDQKDFEGRVWQRFSDLTE